MSNDDAAGRAKQKRGSRNRTGGGSAKARRKAARLAAVQALYQIDLNQIEPTGIAVESVIGEFINHRLGEEIDGAKFVSADPQLFADIVRGAAHRRTEVDGMLASALEPRYALDRLELLMRAILRAGAYELFVHNDTHPRILISEYVDVAHAFFAAREPGMVNGVLDHVARALRPDELAQPDPSRDQPTDR
ncbi:transcription antitermination factor NusB [Azospirillum brasilense]|uniref:Transcription antitermination protein NusB n=1 Tax=Azospirillum brasilense TaxID=192 RepID=A0A6L3BB27_AZOBR|nr:transcription antitermination factor NusB [Azospirillum brasilense]KAA0688890.1 transcription antitermination factor NusB [Azospirillum brasilense]